MATSEMQLKRKAFLIAMAKKEFNGNQVAQAAGLTPTCISAVKCGKTCRAATAMKIAKALDVKLEDIFEAL